MEGDHGWMMWHVVIAQHRSTEFW